MSALAPAAIALLLAAELAASPTDPAEVLKARVDGTSRLTVPVRIDAAGPFDFLVDTGSQRTAVSTDLAARMTFEPGENRQIVGIAGTRMTRTARVREIGLGRRSFRDLSVLLLESEHIGADGIIGLDSLQNQRVQIDFRTNTMTVSSARDQGGQTGYEIVVTARRREGQLIVTDATINGIACAVVIDTGSQTSIGNSALETALRRRVIREETLLSVTGQTTVVRVVNSGKLSIGEMSINNPLIAFADSPAFRALKLDRKPALMLGMRELRMFERIAIDFAERKVLFDLPPGI